MTTKESARPSRRVLILLLSVVGFGASQVAASVANKVSIDAFSTQLAFFQAQFMNLVYVVLGVPLMLGMQWKGAITQSERLGWFHIIYAVTGVLDSVAILAMAFGGNETPGDWQTVIQQGTVPLTLIFAPIVFKRVRTIVRASRRGFILANVGAAVLLSGIVVTIVPGMRADTDQYQASAVVIFSSANIFSTVSFLLKEYLLQDHGGSAVMLNVWNATYLLLISFAFWPLQSLDSFGGIPMNQLPGALWDGARCFAGEEIPGSQCAGVWVSEMVFSVGTFTAGALAVVMVKEASAAFQWSANALVVPLSNFAFAIPWVPVSAQQPIHWYTIVGAVLVMGGFGVYGCGEELQKRDAEKRAKEEVVKLRDPDFDGSLAATERALLINP